MSKPSPLDILPDKPNTAGGEPLHLPQQIPPSATDALPSLDSLRHGIDAIDRQMVALLNERASISRQVGQWKKKHNLPVLQPDREAALLQKLESLSSPSLPPEHLRNIYREILSSSRALQQDDCVGFLGPEGTFSHMACLHFFGASTTAIPCASICDIFQALEQNRCQYAIIPIENSLFGTVSESFDQLIRHEGIQIVAEHVERIHLSLLSAGTSMEAITTVYSHPQPLGQCSVWLNNNLPSATLVPVESTAAAAYKAASSPHSAAIGHARVGLINKLPLHVLVDNIEDMPDNWTRFFIVTLADIRQTILQRNTTPADKSTLTFSVPNTPGSLARVLQIFAEADANLSKLESRPSRTGTWKYVFFADLNCNVLAPRYTAMRSSLAACCHDMRVLGVYTASTAALPDNPL